MAKAFIAIMLLLLASAAFAATAGNQSESGCAYFFYGNGCPHCANVESFLSGFKAENPQYSIVEFEVYNNKANLVLMNQFFDSYNVSQDSRGVPTVFLNDRALIGDSQIISGIGTALASGNNTACPSASGEGAAAGEIPLFTVIGAALVDSINPCAIAVLLILMGALLASGERRRALYSGIAFTASVYISYFLLGLGLFSAIQVSGLAYWFYRGVGFLAIIIGLLNIKDYFWYAAGGFAMEIPRSWRPTLKGLLKSVTSPLGAFAMGFVVCLFELPCTGGPYLFILGLLAERATQAAAIPVLLLYNVFFVLPLLFLTGVIYLGLSNVEKADKWKEDNLRNLHLIAGLIMLLLGLVVALNIV